MGLQSRVNSDRFNYLRSSLLYVCLELDIDLNTFWLLSCIVDTFLVDLPLHCILSSISTIVGVLMRSI